MTEPQSWSAVRTELDRWTDAGLTARLWLRDDDAVAATPALSQLLDRCDLRAIPSLLAVIPMLAQASLPAEIGRHAGVHVAMHGISHQNHAPAGRKSEELALERGRSEIVALLSQARARLCDVLGREAGRIYVPPWNRIATEVAGWLPECGFAAVSTFGPPRFGNIRNIIEANTHIDIINWKGGRVGRTPDWVASEFERQLALARANAGTPVGVLTHHLVHDATAWHALDALFATTCGHPAVRWISPTELLQSASRP